MSPGAANDCHESYNRTPKSPAPLHMRGRAGPTGAIGRKHIPKIEGAPK